VKENVEALESRVAICFSRASGEAVSAVAGRREASNRVAPPRSEVRVVVFFMQ
jgi:hypothetical protein